MSADATEWFRAEGRCLCGAVRLLAPRASRHLDACHCGLCRRWSGGPMLALDCGTELRIRGDRNVTVYDSSEWAQRGFCARCGTHLFYRTRADGNHFVPVGLFDDAEGVRFASQIFVDDKPGYYSFAERTREMTGAEAMAAFEAKG